MSETGRAGLAAVIITLLIAGSVAGLAILISRPDGASVIGPAKGLPAAQKSDEGDFDYALRHRWWAERPTRAKLEQLLTTIVSCQRRDTVWVDDRCNTSVTTSPTDTPAEYGGGPVIIPPNLRPARCFHIYLGGATRPTREEALRKLVVKLDAADYD